MNRALPQTPIVVCDSTNCTILFMNYSINKECAVYDLHHSRLAQSPLMQYAHFEHLWSLK